MYPRTTLTQILQEQYKEVELEKDIVISSKLKTLVFQDAKEFIKMNKKLKKPKKPIKKKKKTIKKVVKE